MRGKITLITGGARSGKSNYAEKLASESKQEVAYIATAKPFDNEMKDRIKKHIANRPKEWTTIEAYSQLHNYISKLGSTQNIVLLDCVTIMITNLMFDYHRNWDNVDYQQIDKVEHIIKKEFQELLRSVREENIWLIAVTNELGMGIVPENRLARIFRDIAGRINQMIAKEADEVIFTVSGIPIKIK